MRILVVEDEPRMAAALERGLVRAGFPVAVAHDGPTGYQLARDEAFDVQVPPGVHVDDSGVAPVQVAGDALLLGRVVANLLSNALRHAVGRAGLGLAVVREACVAHGGSVQVGTGELGGALVRVRLPGPGAPSAQETAPVTGRR